MTYSLMRRNGVSLLLVLLGLSLSGCVSGMLARKMVAAPNGSHPSPVAEWLAKRIDETYAESWRVPVGRPDAELSVAVVEPGNYSFRYGMLMDIPGRKQRRPNLTTNWEPKPEREAMLPPRGTVVLLHGFLVAKESMMHWALFFAQHGYRAVLVDLRGHGASSGERITFGAAEAADLMIVMDELERRGLAAGRVNVLGCSYGGVMGLHWAARDARVGAVVTLQAYGDPYKAVMEFARGFPGMSKLARGISDATFAAAMKRAAKLADFAWSDASVLDSLSRLRFPVLFYHGAMDTWIFPAHGEVLAAAAPAGSRLVLVPGDDHISLALRLDPIALDVLDWFQQHERTPELALNGGWQTSATR